MVEKILITYNDTTALKHYLSHFIAKNYNLEVQWFHLTGHQPILTDPDYQFHVIKQLKKIIIDEKIDYLICLFEEIFFISKIKTWLEEHCKILISDPEIYNKLHDKRLGYIFSKENNIKTLPTMQLTENTTKQNIEKFINNNYPIYLKHYDSRGGWGTEIYHSVDKLLASDNIRNKMDEYIIQPCIKGDIYVLNVLYSQGKLIDRHIIKKISLWDDQSTVRLIPFNLSKNVDIFDDILINIGKASYLSGMVDIEFIVNEDIYLMEYNPRFSGDFPPAIINDASIVYNYMNLLLGKRITTKYSYDEIMTSLDSSFLKRYFKRQLSQNKSELFKLGNMIKYYKMKKSLYRKTINFTPYKTHLIDKSHYLPRTTFPRINEGLNRCRNSSAVFVGLIHNDVDKLKKCIEYVLETAKLFRESKIVIFENDSSDGTVEYLQELSQQHPHIDIISEKNDQIGALSHGAFNELRFNKMARFRNKYLDHVKQKYPTYDYLITVDFDYEFGWWIKGIPDSLGITDDWACITSNGRMKNKYGHYVYNDFAALITKKFKEKKTYFGLHQSGYIKLNKKPLEVISGFCGLAIYKMKYAINCSYVENGICEHIEFNKQIGKYGKILINPNMITFYNCRDDEKKIITQSKLYRFLLAYTTESISEYIEKCRKPITKLFYQMKS